MSALNYQLDSTKAREGSGGGNLRITESGKYVGVITQARQVTASTGSIGIEINFEDRSGASANYMTLWTRNKDGEPIYGEKQLHALMTCLKLRTLESVRGKAQVYENDQMVEQAADIYPALMNIPIGFILQAEEYEGKNGIKNKMNIFMPFDASTNKTAIEILDNAPATVVDKVAPTIKDKKLPAASNGHQSSQSFQAANNDFDDSIPF